MKGRLTRKTGSTTHTAPLGGRHWREVVDEMDSQLREAADSMAEEAVCDLWLEDPSAFMGGREPEDQRSPMIRRVKVGGLGRAADLARRASWDRDFADAQEHARALLGG